ncbi:MAG: YdeI/OmpD-associated family protein [Pelomonas sp.]|nr:YdeI/OmpD-associated family protein [Roseateles sp.]
MATPDPRVDAYIAAAPEFARPVLERLRRQVHAACPEVAEHIKWGAPHFLLDGKMLCHMAAFKAHCAFGFWRRAGAPTAEGEPHAMGVYGRIDSVKGLPPATRIKADIRRAMTALRNGAGAPTAKRPPRARLDAPADLLAALAQAPAARRHFEAFAPSKQRDYVEWVLEAKRADTRAKRIGQAVEWLAEGKSRHWKYEAC